MGTKNRVMIILGANFVGEKKTREKITDTGNLLKHLF
jgi:hypothetical protein